MAYLPFLRIYRKYLIILCLIGFILIGANSFQNVAETSLECDENSRVTLRPKNQRKGYLAIDYESLDIYGLGNKLFELLATIGIADSLNRIPYIHTKNPALAKLDKVVRPMFPQIEQQFEIIYCDISVKNVSNFQPFCCFFNRNMSSLKEFSDEFLLLNGRYFQSYKYFDHLRPKIKQWLLPKKEVQEKAVSSLPQEYRNHFVICAHIRRGDFVTEPHHSATDANSTARALVYLMNKHKRRHQKVAAAIIGDDKKWSSEFVKNRKNMIAINNTAVEDFAFTRIYCDAVLITAPSSTFGWFLGYLSKGRSVYYLDPKKTKDETAQKIVEEDFFLPNWIKLRIDDERIKEFPRWARGA